MGRVVVGVAGLGWVVLVRRCVDRTDLVGRLLVRTELGRANVVRPHLERLVVVRPHLEREDVVGQDVEREWLVGRRLGRRGRPILVVDGRLVEHVVGRLRWRRRDARRALCVSGS
jgi:hypothetical protein